LLTSVAILTFVLTGIVSADSHNDYCYDEDMEGFICFETLKVCEMEKKDDLTAESLCYESQE
jgi:hypothetical protein